MTLLPNDERIETDRLVLRRIQNDDLDFYARIHANPDVARYIAHGNPRSLDETRSWLAAMLDSYATLSLGQLAVLLKSDGSLVGRCGVSHLETDTTSDANGIKAGYYYPTRAPEGSSPLIEAELGYTFDQAVWGKGYASEAVGGVLDYLKRRRRDLRVVSLIMAENTRSVKVASRFAVRFVDRVGIWGRVFDRYLYPEPSS